VASTFLNLVSLPLGVVGHEGSTVIVVTNGLTLLGYRPSRETARARQLHAAPAAAD